MRTTFFDSLKDLLIASDVSNPGVIIVHEQDNLDSVMKQFGRSSMDELPVVARRNGKEEVVGTIWQRDVIEAYNHQIFLRDMSGEASAGIQNLKLRRSVHVVDKYHFSEIEAPSTFVGKTLQEINLRNKYDLEIMLIKRKDKSNTKHLHPSAKTKIEMHDSLLIFGPQDKIDLLNRI